MNYLEKLYIRETELRGELQGVMDEIKILSEDTAPEAPPEPEIDYEAGGAPASQQDDAPVEEPRGGAAGEGRVPWTPSEAVRITEALLAEEIAGLMLPPEWQDGEMTPAEAREHLKGEIRARLRSALPPISSLLGELAELRGVVEEVAAECESRSDLFAKGADASRATGQPASAQRGFCEAYATAGKMIRSAMTSDAGRLAGEVLRSAAKWAADEEAARKAHSDHSWNAAEETKEDLYCQALALLAAHPEIKEAPDGE